MTFTDAVDTGRFKICKASTEPSLQNTAFVFSYSYSIGNTPFTGTATSSPAGVGLLRRHPGRGPERPADSGLRLSNT